MTPEERTDYFRGPVEPNRPRKDRSGGTSSIALLSVVLAVAFLFAYAAGWVTITPPWSSQADVTVLYDESLVTDLFEQSSPAVVEIAVFGQSSLTNQRVQGVGSGFFIDSDGHIVTNNHVVEGFSTVEVDLYDGRTLTAAVLGRSPADDLALLQVDPSEVEGIVPLRLADSDGVKPGQLAVAIGSPFRDFNSVSVGVVSGVGRTRQSALSRPIPDLIQTDAALNPGNSGGPLIDSNGEVMGINTAVQVVSSVQIGVGFAVPSNSLSGILDDLKEPGEFSRPWIGISGHPASDLPDTLDISTRSGIYVRQVFADSPASEAGLRPDRCARTICGGGDIITSVDSVELTDIADMVSYLNDFRPGDTVTITVVRDGEVQALEVVLAEWQR